ncbi:hypothetical protein DK45_4590 [Bordetella bronchiseptica]|nr:hypothetical protein DK45_4590 [Bordetella bronchiseptica]
MNGEWRRTGAELLHYPVRPDKVSTLLFKLGI